MTSAGMVNVIPALTTSPADAVVCTMLCSRMLVFFQKLKNNMDRTAAGIEPEIVLPTLRATYVFDAHNTIAKTKPSKTALSVISGRMPSFLTSSGASIGSL